MGRFLVMLLLLEAAFHVVSGFTDAQDATVIRSLKDAWQNLPPSWLNSDDPCGDQWDGITCNNSRIVSMRMSSMGIKGSMSGDIGGLDALLTLDLSNNPDLSGPLTPRVGNLKNLNTLILLGCGFTGRIPEELGNLSQLTFLALNSNQFTGEIPSSLGKLSKLYWLDLAENQLTGSIPVSPGLDQLLNAKHFHLNKNRLSGFIPRRLFSSSMVLIHILFDGNSFTGNIPETLGLVQSLEVLRLDRNNLIGSIPESINDLTNLNELHLANNSLTGIIPDLSRLGALNYIDLSHNSFEPSAAPDWFSTLQTLTTLVMENAELTGTVPTSIFSFPQLQQVNLSNNRFSGTLDLGQSISNQLQLVDLQFNNIIQVTVGSRYTDALELFGNPVCSRVPNLPYCQLQQPSYDTYSTSLTSCGKKQCSTEEKLNPQSCNCAFPYEGTLFFRAPRFSDLSNSTRLQSLESSLWTKLLLNSGSVFLQNLFFNSDDYLQVQVALFPSDRKYFNRSEIQRIGFDLSNQSFKPPPEFGPYYFIASPYYAFLGAGKSSTSTGLIIGIAVGCTILVLVLVGVGIYAYRQKKRAERAIELSKPFASWAPGGKDSGGAPQLKGARWFSYDELKKSTSNFSENNEIGSGGYGKVYKGTLSNGQYVAIKRSQQGSMQGGVEFKTEIELLSRVHHKNLVSLVGFCFDQGEQMLVYEYISNGSLRESLSGKSGIVLDWKRRLRIALGSARGLAYLHDLANPPIIHRDVKSTNILLDDNLTAKVADFGLSKLVSDSEKGHVSTQVKGTLGYLDPEYYMTQQLTEKSDVYSFGVVMLELITARQPIERGKYIVREVRMAMDKSSEHCGLKDIMDIKIRNATNLVGFARFLNLAMQCVEESRSDRPTMSDAVKEIETILQNNGLQTTSTSASSSATDFGSTKGPGSPRHPYNDPLPRKEENSSGAFEYSGGYTFSVKVEPK